MGAFIIHTESTEDRSQKKNRKRQIDFDCPCTYPIRRGLHECARLIRIQDLEVLDTRSRGPPMDSIVFFIQLGLSTLVCWLLAEWFLVPILGGLSRSRALLLLIVPQAFRHLGLYALTQAAFEPYLASAWAVPVAIGDTS